MSKEGNKKTLFSLVYELEFLKKGFLKILCLTKWCWAGIISPFKPVNTTKPFANSFQ